MNLPTIGCTKKEIDTPILCVDLDVMDDNVRSIVATCRQHGIDWRPHTKCPKSPAVAKKLMAAGAIGVTCAKLGEAEVMAAAGVQEILVANMIVGPHKVERLVDLRRRADVIICVDHIEQAQAFSQAMAAAGLTLRLLIEVNIGLDRVGAQPGEPTLELAQQIDKLPGVTLAGIMGYEGHLLKVEDPAEKADSIRAALAVLTQTKELIEQSGIACPIVSCGGTGSFRFSVQQPGITELQAGGAIFMDAFYRNGCHVPEWNYALTVVTTVVSRPAADRAIVDAGRKTMDGNNHPPLVVGRDDIHFDSLSAEHGTLRLDPSAQSLRIGDRLDVIPGYSDMTCVMHDYFFGFRQDRLEVIWPLEGRGKLQ